MLTDARLFALLDVHAPARAPPLVPELRAWHASDELPLWQALEAEHGAPLEPPFFAVAWPGAQALARVLLDDPALVRGCAVADVGAGSGLASVAAMCAGATTCMAYDVDALALRAAKELGRRHDVVIATATTDALAAPGDVRADVILAGDLVYNVALRDQLGAALAVWRAAGKRILVADSGRPFFDASSLRLTPRASFEVPTPVVLDGATCRRVTVYDASPR